MENTVTNVSPQVVPQEIRKWNWGAFMYNIFWGIGNKTYLPLLCLIPLFNIIWVFVCGAKGNEWAWKNGNYSSAQEFLLVQSTWSRAGLVAFIVTIIFVVLYVLLIGTMLAAISSSFR
ncbi:ribonuclease G [Clostridium sp.]|uniref:ribonuclease G n=1 Tax=Clostridium sp. TaxID=1506 RepID=UPI00262759DE|nr:ribonuclease G [Clostridium sp.]